MLFNLLFCIHEFFIDEFYNVILLESTISRKTHAKFFNSSKLNP